MNDDTLDTMELEAYGGRCDRGYSERRKDKCYIPISLLTLVDSKYDNAYGVFHDPPQ